MTYAETLIPNPRKYDDSVRRYARLFGLFGFETHNDENAILDGPAIYVPTHRSIIDIPMIAMGLKQSADKRGSANPRRLHIMAKTELFESPLKSYIEPRGAFPVDRENPQPETLAHATRILRGGDAIGMFGEGTRKSGPRIEKVKRGAGLIALTTPDKEKPDPIPVIAVGIAGTETPKLRPIPTHCHLVYAEPLYHEGYFPIDAADEDRRKLVSAASDFTRQIKDALQNVFDIANDLRSNS
jgi:1-acyl-sn-glycerol-3-phosphate acyltransferase